jgi:hypothetical protein
MNMLLLLLSQALLVSAAAQNVGDMRQTLGQQAEGGFGKRVISGAGATFPCVSLILAPQEAAAHCT